MNLENLITQIAIVIGLNEGIKGILISDEQRKLIPFISVVLGVAVCLLLFPFESIQTGLRDGIISGLSAVGAFSLGKKIGGQ